jgi:hypothetical protein
MLVASGALCSSLAVAAIWLIHNTLPANLPQTILQPNEFPSTSSTPIAAPVHNAADQRLAGWIVDLRRGMANGQKPTATDIATLESILKDTSLSCHDLLGRANSVSHYDKDDTTVRL